MKNKLVSILILMGAMACNKLDLQPLDRVTSATFYENEADFDGAVLAAYSSIQDLWGTSTETLGEFGEFWKITVVITDDVAADLNGADGISRDVDNLFIRASDKPYAAAYTQIYEGIYRANLVLENLEGENQLTPELKSRFEGEAKFLRAFFHFLALKMWGTPPLITQTNSDINNLAVPNAAQDELYAQILSDFGDAAAKLPEKWGADGTGRATSWAAKSFIGKVNVWKKDWNAAVSSFEEVINSGNYQLEEEYEDVFAYNNENNNESIFEIQYGGPFSDDNLWVFDDTHSEAFKASQGTGRGWHWDPGNGAPGGKLGQWAPTQDLVDEYLKEPGDKRLAINVYREGDTYYTTDGFRGLPYDPTWSTTSFSSKKYRGERNIVPANHSGNLQADFNNERWYRYGELKLLYAEALIEVGRMSDAATQINDIRRRAGLSDLPAGTDLTEAMRREKRLELAMEPHRWFDIVRWGIGSQVFGSKWDDKFAVFPFPQYEIDVSKGVLKQNPGY